MNSKGNIFFATDYAKKNYKEKKKIKKNNCPSCEIKIPKIVVESTYLEDEIRDEDLKN
ncbi:MAG: hypothetical protein FWD14_01925 [Treponema sp.]|nr:hypothetical protein [Treponema sp.]